MYTPSSLRQSPEESNQSHGQVPGGPSHNQCSDDDVPEPRPTYNYTSYTNYRFVDHFQLRSLAADDAAFLESEGCFSLPGPAALEEFIRQFFKRVHPLVPVIDEAGFWDIYRNKTLSSCKVSLFVLQSMLFASSTVGVSPLSF